MRFSMSRCSTKNMCLKFKIPDLDSLRFSKCCFFFTPRQGTMLIAILELALTSILLFLLLIAAMNSQDIATAATNDSIDIENNWASIFGDKFSLSWYYNKNEKKMVNGQYLARIMVMLTFGGVVLSMVHIFSCLMLLYGSLYEIPHFLLPWLSTVLFSLIISSLMLISLFVYVSQKCLISVYLVPTLLLVLELYSWLVVFNYYKDVTISNAIREEAAANGMKNGVFDF